MGSINYTSSLPKDLMDMLNSYASQLKLPKNRIVEKALRAYFDQIKKAEYAHSFRRAAGDEEQILMAEEGLEDYLKIISEE